MVWQQRTFWRAITSPTCGWTSPRARTRRRCSRRAVTLDRCLAPCMKVGVPCFGCGGPSEAIILEPQKDVRSEVAMRMAHLTAIPHDEIVAEIERQAKTHFAYAMASPVFRQKPTFLLKKWSRASAEKGVRQ